MSQPPNLKPPRILTWLVFIALINAVILLFILLPFEPFISLVIVAVIVGVVVLGWRSRLNLQHSLAVTLRLIRRGILGQTPDIPTQTATFMIPPRLLYGLEIALIVLVALWVTGENRYLADPIPKLRGWEAEWLTSSATFAAQSLHEYGYLPKWQPYLEFGEPLIHNPFSFVANPISTLPTLLFGGISGIKISILLYTILAGVGGWFLAKVLGCATPARLLLAVLLIGKGNMHGMIATGYFQLGVSQAYFPWVIGGILAIIGLPKQRWPVILTALMLALMFTAGNIWYMLPTLVAVVFLVVFYTLIIPGKLDTHALKRLVFAGVLTIGLSAITLLPIWLERGYIGDHPNVVNAGDEVALDELLPLFFTDDRERILHIANPIQDTDERSVESLAYLYYTFVSPLWFVTLLFIVVPPIWPLLHRTGQPGTQGIWLVGGVMMVLATLWATGKEPLFLWLYDNVPFLGQWRFVGRALAIASFWMVVLIGLRFDGLWRAIMHLTRYRLLRIVAVLAGGALILAGGYAGYLVNAYWGYSNMGDPPVYKDRLCLDWLRAQEPDKWLTVYRGGYDAVTTFLENRARLFNIEADYAPLPLEATIGNVPLTSYVSLPEYAIAWEDILRGFLRENGYQPVADSPQVADQPCLWRKADAVSYAYTIPLTTINHFYGLRLDAALTTPITTWEHRPDEIGLIAHANPRQKLVLTVQELAYPGWLVEVDGQPATLESVGGQIGVILPLDDRAHTVYFAFRPPLLYLGGWITLLTCVFSMGYLLRVERLRGCIRI